MQWNFLPRRNEIWELIILQSGTAPTEIIVDLKKKFLSVETVHSPYVGGAIKTILETESEQNRS